MKLSEAYVTRAEAYARTGEKDLAIADLNRLLVTRIKKGDYVALDNTSFTDETALQRVLEERRVELAFDGGMRWLDLRRLGKTRTCIRERTGVYLGTGGFTLRVANSGIGTVE